METETVIVVVVAPVLWTIVWQSLRKFRLVPNWWARLVIIIAWMFIGDFFLARGRNLHIPGLWELLFIPLTPFRAVDHYQYQARLHGVAPDQWVYYEVFGMFVGFLILFHCVSIHQFLWQRPPGKEIKEGPDDFDELAPQAASTP